MCFVSFISQRYGTFYLSAFVMFMFFILGVRTSCFNKLQLPDLSTLSEKVVSQIFQPKTVSQTFTAFYPTFLITAFRIFTHYFQFTQTSSSKLSQLFYPTSSLSTLSEKTTVFYFGKPIFTIFMVLNSFFVAPPLEFLPQHFCPPLLKFTHFSKFTYTTFTIFHRTSNLVNRQQFYAFYVFQIQLF